MSFVIYKYPLEVGQNTLMLSSHAKILCVHVQRKTHYRGYPLNTAEKVEVGEIMLWAMHDPHGHGENKRTFLVLGTGDAQPDVSTDSLEYIGTVHETLSRTVWHVFELLGSQQK